MTTFEEFLMEIKESFKQYDSAGLMNDLTIYNWVLDGLNPFAMLPTIRVETVLTVKNNKAKLPDGFKSIYSAVKCEPFGYTTDDEKGEDILQDIYFYKVREIKNSEWALCDPCEMVETETCVVEKVYLHNGTRANFYYNNAQPIRLKLTPHVKRTNCDKDCLNFKVTSSPYEISINQRTLYTNFKEGNIFMVYNGYEEDEDGFILVPDTEEGWLRKYLIAMVKKNIIEDVLANSDNTTNEQFLYTLYIQQSDEYFKKAMGEMKLKRVLQGMGNYKNKLRKEISVYNFGEYSYNNGIQNRTEFIIQ